MKKTNNEKVKVLLKHIVNETFTMMQEEHQRGEWWIDDSGMTTFCDNTIGDAGHEGIVISNLSHEILSHFGVELDDVGYLSEWEDKLRNALIDDDRFTPEDEAEWDSKGPREVILKKIIEDNAYKTPEQAKDAVYIAWGSPSIDARDYAMKYWKWKIMKAQGMFDIEIQTWFLTPEDIGIIVSGVWDIMEEDTDDPEDNDNAVGDDGYPGPRINLTIQSKGKRFHDIPLAVLEKKVPSALFNYRSGLEEGYDHHHFHKEYRLYEGHNKIVALFEDNSRLFFEVHYHNNHGEDKEKWRHKAFTKWKSLAAEIHNDVQLTEVGNPIQKSWKQSFEEALKHPDLQEYIRGPHHQRVFDNNEVIDPVNFTNYK